VALENKLRKSIIVTGASSGIGKATAIKLVESGYQVFGLARRYDKISTFFSSQTHYQQVTKKNFIFQYNLILPNQKCLKRPSMTSS
jgi:NADP-dependent 3-hydroxy acid dehydrogenase YdfG